MKSRKTRRNVIRHRAHLKSDEEACRILIRRLFLLGGNNLVRAEFNGAHMRWNKKRVLALGLALSAIVTVANLKLRSQQPAPASQTAKPVGTIKAISSDSITLKMDAGADVNVIVQGTPRLLRIAPGQTDLKSASPIQFQDLQVGDRILVTGKLAEDGKSVVASAIVAMKAADVQAKQQKERMEWQRGAGGLVDSVDAGSGIVSISVAAPGGVRKIAIQTTRDTVFRRYAPNSVNFDDAKPSALDQIKTGDQVRARGTRNPDGTEFAAVEVISGSFRNISGTITSIDPAANTIRVADLATKKPVLVQITADSQVRKLPPEIAQRIAMQLRTMKTGGPAGAAPDGAQPAAQTAKSAAGPNDAGSAQPRGPGGSGRAPDFQQLVGRLPQVPIASLQNGDAVMIVSTEGTSSGGVTAITLLGGVEPILTAPGGGQGVTLSPWSLGGGGGEGDAGGQ
jgi:transcription antitermination factor NusG